MNSFRYVCKYFSSILQFVVHILLIQVTPDGAVMVIPPGSTEPDLGETNNAYEIERGDSPRQGDSPRGPANGRVSVVHKTESEA